MVRIAVAGLAVLLPWFIFLPDASAQVITTVVGRGRAFRADGSPAINAPLGAVQGVVVDPAGNVFVSDSYYHLVVKVSTSGVLSVVAGNGIAGFSGDGGPATGASLNQPWGLALDRAGNLYIADALNNRIRKVSSGGTITSVAGNGIAGFSGDGGPATSASLNNPVGVAVDAAGNLYISDAVNGRVRKVSSNGTITTVAGGGSASPGDGGPATNARLAPMAVAVDAAGNLYISDDDARIRKVSSNGTISTVAGGGSAFPGDGGPATSAQLDFTPAVAVDATGNLYISDAGHQRIRKVDLGGIISTVAGNGVAGFSGDGGPGSSASIGYTFGLAVDAAGNLYLADTSNTRVRKLNTAGIITTIAGAGLAGLSGEGISPASALLFSPSAVAVDATGNLYIGDTFGFRVRKVSPGGTITTVAGKGVAGFSGDGGAATDALLVLPFGVAVDSAGNLFIADFGNERVRKVSPGGIITTVAGGGSASPGDGGPATSAGINDPLGVAVDAAGNPYISEGDGDRVRKVTPAGIITTVAGIGSAGFSGDGGPATRAALGGPTGLAVDTFGNLYIADTRNHRIRKVNSAGIITTIAGNGIAGFSGDGGPATSASVNEPRGVAVDAAGNVYISDTLNNRIRKVSAAGAITTAAGTGSAAFSGDCGPATGAALNLPRSLLGGVLDNPPSGLAVDTAGNLYIADGGNDRIRKISFAAQTSSPAPNLPPDSVVNGATFRAAADPNGAIAPGTTVAIFGTNLASSTQVALAVPLSTALLDNCVGFSAGGSVFAASLFFVSGGQINAQVPFDLPTGTASVQVRRGDQASSAQPVKVAAVSPGIFSLNQQGTGAGAILHADSFELVNESNPARPGEFLALFCNGLGLVEPAVASGRPAPSSPPLAETVSRPVVNIGGIPARVVFSGLAPGFVGLYQVNVQAPMEVPPGTQAVQIIMNGVPSNTVTVAVSQ